MLSRSADWAIFCVQVQRHIKQYAEVQYANSEDTLTDQVGMYTPEECMLAIDKYRNRFRRGVRGPVEQLRDMLKIAHYAQRCYYKLKEEYKCEDVYLEPNSFEG